MKNSIKIALIIFLSFAGLQELLFAQTGGIGQPEYSSFEPPGGSSVAVQPQSGDLTYKLPAIHIPGPGGGYTMSLFYHAGIKNEQVASWVGLGWNLNAGAINRRCHQSVAAGHSGRGRHAVLHQRRHRHPLCQRVL